MRASVALLVAALVLALAPGPGLAYGDGFVEPDAHRAVVLEVTVREDDGTLPAWAVEAGALTVRIRITRGPLAGQEMDVAHYMTGNPAYDLDLRPGDRVLVGIETVGGQVVDAYVMEYVRDLPVAIMVGLFVLALVAVGGLKGAKAALVLGLTGLSVAYILIPLILAGFNPVWVTVMVSAGVVSAGMVMIAGLSRKALAAGAGTVFGVVVAGLLAALFGRLSNLLGLSTQEAQMLMFTPDLNLDFRGLLFAGMILGALGAIMDVGMSIASAVEEVKGANPAAGFWDLARSGLNVGRDVLGTMANTLILAYAGGALPLLLLLSAHNVELIKVANLDLVATEVVRAMSGSLGLIMCVPVTALVAARLGGARR